MNALLIAGAINAALASLLAACAFAVSYRWPNPFVARGFWLAVMARFVAPPLLLLPLVSIPTPLLAPEAPAFIVDEPSQSLAREPRAGLPSTAVIEPVSSQALPMALADRSISTQSPDRPHLSGISYRHVLAIISGVWMGGSLLILIIAVLRIFRFHRHLESARLAPADLQERTARIASQVGVRRPPQMRLTEGRTSPLVWCIGRSAVILLPAELVRRLDDAQMTAVLAHELTHIRRKDGWARWLELIVVSLFWWCPVAWWARCALHEAEERCCDADALAKFPMLRRKFADALLITLDYVAPAKRMEFAATGFVRRGSLTRRFEMIISAQPQSRPPRSLRMILALAALAALIATPIAATPPPTGAEAVPDAQRQPRDEKTPTPQRCTIKLKDGTLIDGEIISRHGDRIVVLKHDAKEPANAQKEPLEEAPQERALQGEVWELSLDECLSIALKFDDRVVVTTLANGSLVLAPAGNSQLTDLEFRDFLERDVRDIDDAYWALWQTQEDLNAVKSGQEAALKTWRQVSARKRAGAADSPNDEASSRSQYFLFRAQGETLIAGIHRNEARLRALIKLSSDDGRLIRPADEPQLTEVSQDFNAICQDAMESRVEAVRQRREVERRKIELRAADLARADGDQEMSIKERHQGQQQRRQSLLLDRERAIEEDLQLEIKHQVGDAVRQYELCDSIVETNRNRTAAADDEVKAVESQFEIGRVSLDLLLDAQRRSVEAGTAYNAARANSARATARLHHRKGSTLDFHDIQLARVGAE